MSWWRTALNYLELLLVVVGSIWVFARVLSAKMPAENEPIRLVWGAKTWHRMLSQLLKWLLPIGTVWFLFLFFKYDYLASLTGVVLAVCMVFLAFFTWTYPEHFKLRLTDCGCYRSYRFVPWRKVVDIHLENEFSTGPVLKFVDRSGKVLIRAGGWAAENRPQIVEEAQTVRRAAIGEAERRYNDSL